MFRPTMKMAALALCSAGVLIPAAAHAHYKLNSPTSWWTQATDGSPQKTAPCGNEGAANTAASKVVTNYQPGQMVPITVQATIAHPGWYRASLKQGASSTQTATTLPDPAVKSGTNCTPAFIDNPVWSTTQPVIADKLGLPAGSTSTTTMQSGTATYMVAIPSGASCTAAAPCTLQVVMFMTDHPAGMCNYHHCADITVVATGTGGAGGGAGGAGGAGGGAAGRGGAGGRGGGAAGSGGATGAGGTGGGSSSAGAAGSTGAGGSGTPGTGGSDSTPGTGGSGTPGTGGSSTPGTGGSSVTGAAGSGTTGSGGSSVTGAAGDGSTGAAGNGTTGAAGSGTGTGGSGSDSGGGCAVAGTRTSGAAALFVLAAVAIGVRRRRRRAT